MLNQFYVSGSPRIPEDFLYKEAHELFKAPDVLTEDVKARSPRCFITISFLSYMSVFVRPA